MMPENPAPRFTSPGRVIAIGAACVLWVGIVGSFVVVKVREFSRMRETARQRPAPRWQVPAPPAPMPQRPQPSSLASLTVSTSPTPSELEAKARAGDASAALQLARIIERQAAGQAGPMNVAFEWRLRAAGLGDGVAMAGVARSYRAGVGVGRDEALAETWTVRATATGGAEQWHRIGTAFQTGTLLPVDSTEATAWHERAAAQGHAGAKAALERMKQRSPGAGTVSPDLLPTLPRAGLGDMFDISALDVLPRPVFQARPRYPSEMRRQRIGGEVHVEFLVDRDGTVRNAQVVSATATDFEEAAVEAVSAWRFEPGRKNGRPVITRMRVPIVFSMNEPAATAPALKPPRTSP